MKKRAMSKEEVLRTLDKLANDYLVYPDETVALDYAIKAVEAFEECNNNTDIVSRNDVISICNILADKMNDEGRVAVEQVRDAVKDMRRYPYKKTCRYCTNSYDSEECYECTANIQSVPPKEEDKCEKCEHCDYYSCPEYGAKTDGEEGAEK